MKLVRYGQPGKEKPGLIDADGRLRDLSGVVKDISPDLLSSQLALTISSPAIQTLTLYLRFNSANSQQIVI